MSVAFERIMPARSPTRSTLRSAPRSRNRPAPIGATPDPNRLREGFERRAADLAAAARRVRTGADVEAIHDLRVAARRMTAALQVWRDLIPARARRDASRSLRRLRRRLGPARELEVHVALTEAHLPDPGPTARRAERPVVEAILERLRERLARRRRSAMKRVSPRRLRRLLRPLEVAASGIGDRLRQRPGTGVDAVAAERRIAERGTASLREAVERPDDEPLHQARIRIKRWRYALECLAEVIPDGPWRPVEPLRELQGALGDVHDRALLTQVFARHAFDPMPQSDREQLHALIEALVSERERALRKFQRLAAAEIDAAGNGGASEPAAEAPSGGPPTSGPPAAASHATGVSISGSQSVDEPATGSPVSEAAAEVAEERWGRIASWLEHSADRG